jgi:hypothetical protein
VAAIRSAVALATRKTRQRPEAASMTGNSRPSWGLSVSKPSRMPASIGFRSGQAKIVSSIAAVTSELCPEITQKTAAAGTPATEDCSPRSRFRRREIGQAAEQRGDEHDARRIRPVLTGIACAQQGRERVL